MQLTNPRNSTAVVIVIVDAVVIAIVTAIVIGVVVAAMPPLFLVKDGISTTDMASPDVAVILAVAIVIAVVIAVMSPVFLVKDSVFHSSVPFSVTRCRIIFRHRQ
jgi:Mg/Co/Ni transporter MgtE